MANPISTIQLLFDKQGGFGFGWWLANEYAKYDQNNPILPSKTRHAAKLNSTIASLHQYILNQIIRAETAVNHHQSKRNPPRRRRPLLKQQPRRLTPTISIIILRPRQSSRFTLFKRAPGRCRCRSIIFVSSEYNSCLRGQGCGDDCRRKQTTRVSNKRDISWWLPAINPLAAHEHARTQRNRTSPRRLRQRRCKTYRATWKYWPWRLNNPSRRLKRLIKKLYLNEWRNRTVLKRAQKAYKNPWNYRKWNTRRRNYCCDPVGLNKRTTIQETNRTNRTTQNEIIRRA